MKKKSLIALLLALAMLLSVGCAKQAGSQETAAPAPETVAESVPEEPAKEEPAPAPETPAEEPAGETVRFGILKGPTGIGAAKLLQDNASGESVNSYEVTVAAEATEIVSMIAAGQLDIAAVPTNAAAALYNKTQGAIRILALNTAGVLYILEQGDTVHSMADLKGKTIYSVGQGANPEYVLRHLLAENGLKDGENVTLEFLDSAELTTKAAAGEIEVCMLPVPAVTTVLMKNSNMRSALNLSEEWDKLNNGSTLTMGCVIAPASYVQDHPEAVAEFLKEYEASIRFVLDDPVAGAAYCEQFEIVPNSKVAEKAIPDANLIFISGAGIRPAIEGYYKVLFDSDPKSIGGALPSDDFYPAA
ncbi:MAG: ABC transporter substrate-binding protein [Clostridia bacterium]|nr:ABC transporter substrate-binding protein [Clostridia bacterium]